MSGGRWGYFQSRFEWEEIIEDLLELVIRKPDGYSKETIDVFVEAMSTIRKAQAYITAIDLLLEGDYGQEGFHQEIAEL